MSKKQKAVLQAKLILEDGSEYLGWAFGKNRSVAGEVVFNTGMSGLVQALTDPGCKGQIFVCTWPIAGNIGVPVNKNGAPFFDEQEIPVILESENIHAAGLIVSDLCEEPSHYSSKISLSSWLEKKNIPGIYGIDTRTLAIRLRDKGTMRGKILVEGKPNEGDLKQESSKQSFSDISFKKIDASNHNGVSNNEIKKYTPSSKKAGIKIALMDCGVKSNVIRCLLNRGAEVIRIPCNLDFDMKDYDGLLISNGPGDPKNYKKQIELVRKALSSSKPVFGIGLGNLIIALAAGADTYKLQFGHRGLNQPSIEEGSGSAGKERCYVTSQNHSFAVRAETLPKGWKKWFTNANDGTIEGIRCENKPFSAVQFYPEGCPGSRDTEYVFDTFISQIKESK